GRRRYASTGGRGRWRARHRPRWGGSRNDGSIRARGCCRSSCARWTTAAGCAAGSQRAADVGGDVGGGGVADRQRADSVAAVIEVIRAGIGAGPTAQVQGSLDLPLRAGGQGSSAVGHGEVVGAAAGQGRGRVGGHAGLVVILFEHVTRAGVTIIRVEI